MARLFYNNASGQLGATLGSSIGNTTITFATVPPFATVGSPDYIPLMVYGGLGTIYGFEIVYLTAYTAGNLTGTVLRQAEDSGNWLVSPHAAGSTWANVPTILDKTQVSWRGYRNAALNLANGTATLIPMDTANWTTGGAYALTISATQGLECNLTGWYQVNAAFGISKAYALDERYFASIQVSGSEWLRGDDRGTEDATGPAAGNNNDIWTASGLVYMVAGVDYIGFYGYNNSGSSSALAVGQPFLTRLDVTLMEVA